MILVMDVGNTNIVLGVYEGPQLLFHWRISTVRDRTEDELGIVVKSLLQDVGLSAGDIDGIAISSVVPPLQPALERMSVYYFGLEPLFVGSDIRTDLPIRYDQPTDVGADRVVNAVAAIAEYGAPLIIVDFGTATTFCVVDETGVYLGGVIAPGISISSEALFQRAAKLPRIELAKPPTVVGRNTVHAMQAGVVYGYIGLVDGLVARIKEELPLQFRVVATGGLAELIGRDSRAIDVVDSDLTLKGLRILWERNPTKGRRDH